MGYQVFAFVYFRGFVYFYPIEPFMTAAIHLDNVSKTYGNFTAVDHLSFTVRQGDIYGFLGPNGSGKSTTLRMMMSLIQPSAGEIFLFGHSLKENRKAIMQKIGCIIEKPDFYTYLSAKENLMLFARASELSLRKADIDKLLEQVGLQGRGSDKVKTFSHGMKQRLGLAQTLIHNPELIILDEPNTGLDPQGIIDLRNLIYSLNREHGKTILFSSHILSEVQTLCTNMIVIHHGKTVVQGKVDELLSTETVTVRLELAQPESGIAFIRQSAWHAYLQEQGDECRFAMPKTEISLLVRALSEAGIAINRIDYKNQLEEYFLKITQH
ncbi:MAG: hypothetical protein RIQ62_307 [Bacteroidota bacterium]